MDPNHHRQRLSRVFFIVLSFLLLILPLPAAAQETTRLSMDNTQLPEVSGSLECSFKDMALEAELDKLLETYLGTPYRYGGTDTRGIDCSGLTQRFYLDMFGITIPHSSWLQSRIKTLETISTDLHELETTDLLFFKNKDRINHVGIYLEDGKFIHALPKKGVTISSLTERYWKKRLVTSRRIKESVLARVSGARKLSTASTGRDIALGYTADVDDHLNVTVETFHSGRVPSGQEQPSIRHSGAFDPASTEALQGVRASAEILPLSWLQIHPSFGLVETQPWAAADETSPWQVYGIETVISPDASPWSVVFSYNRLFNNTVFNNTGEAAADTDVGLHFSYSLTDSVRFSLTGSWEGTDLLRENGDFDITRDLHNLSVSFEISF